MKIVLDAGGEEFHNGRLAGKPDYLIKLLHKSAAIPAGHGP